MGNIFFILYVNLSNKCKLILDYNDNKNNVDYVKCHVYDNNRSRKLQNFHESYFQPPEIK